VTAAMRTELIAVLEISALLDAWAIPVNPKEIG
jgi:hypothetical protein